jgi:ABC-type transport system involved in multi-copper enzyme maturation permease subunit
MAVNIFKPRPNLWNMYRHELFKGRKQIFYKLLLGFPAVLISLVGMLQALVRVLNSAIPNEPVPDFSLSTSSYDFGGKSAFGLANLLGLQQLGGALGLIVVVACALSVANEYRWNTIKMLALRQPSRARLVVAKGLFALSIIAGVFLSALVGWLVMAFCGKYYFGTGFEINSADLDAMGKGIKFFALANLQTFILALAAIALTFKFKSVIAGLVSYLIYNVLDSGINAFGRGVINNGYGLSPDWMHPIMDICKVLQPFTLTGSIDRIAMREQIYVGAFVPNPNIVASNPLWGAWLMVGFYIVGYTALAIYFFASRDITD